MILLWLHYDSKCHIYYYGRFPVVVDLYFTQKCRYYGCTTIILRFYFDCSPLWHNYHSTTVILRLQSTMVPLWSYYGHTMIPWALCSKYLFLCLYYNTTSIVLRFYLDCRDYVGTTTLLLFYYDSLSLVQRQSFSSTTTTLRLYYYLTTILGVYQRLSIFASAMTVLLRFYYDFTRMVLPVYYGGTMIVLPLHYCQPPPSPMGGYLDPLCLAVLQMYIQWEELASITASGWTMIVKTTRWTNFELPHAVRSRPSILSLFFLSLQGV